MLFKCGVDQHLLNLTLVLASSFDGELALQAVSWLAYSDSEQEA